MNDLRRVFEELCVDLIDVVDTVAGWSANTLSIVYTRSIQFFTDPMNKLIVVWVTVLILALLG